MVPKNPFAVSTDTEFATVGREADLGLIRAALRSQFDRLIVVARRRMGLSTLLAAAVAKERAEGVRVAHVQLDVAMDARDIASRTFSAIADAFGREHANQIGAIASLVEPNLRVTSDAAGESKYSIPDERHEPNLGVDVFRILDATDEVLERSEIRLAVVLDDFEVLLRGARRPDWSLKSAAERHRRISYVLASTSEHEVLEQIHDRRSGLWRAFSLHQLEPIGEPVLLRWVIQRFRMSHVALASSTAERIVFMAGPRAGDIARLCRGVWDNFARVDHVAEADVDHAMEEIVLSLDSFYRTLWELQGPGKRRVLAAMALDPAIAPTSSGVLHRYQLGSKSSAHRAVGELVRDGVVYRDPQGEWRFDDPFLRTWIGKRVHDEPVMAGPP